MGDQGGESAFEARLFQLLELAATWPETEREERAAAVCATGPVSADVLLAALGRGERLGGFLESPAWRDATLAGIDGDSTEGQHRRPGQTVGRFRLIESIGRGGMGQVFLAEQDQPYRRVALKLIRSDGISPTTLRRFDVEQQALARLNHPHIAQLYEAGLTDDSEPYCAMEWIDGEPIDVYPRAHALDLEARLRLFVDICSAIRHAHQKQIVHRDLKPSNILVSEVDGRPVAKVIDFGIAEALDSSAPKRRGDSRRLFGTPGYLSPEAFDGDVDTRSDIYSLGVLLYQILAGAHPFRQQSECPDELVTRIRTGDVAPASHAAADLDPATIEPEVRGWASRLRGDLDAIIAKAMHPDRDERYDSVSELAADLERFLANQPVRARKAGFWHLARLFSRRRRAVVLAAAVALFSIVAGGFGLSFGLLRAQQEATETRQALREAEELADFLTDLFRESDPNRAQGHEPTARDLLAKGRERLRSEALADQPLTRARLSRTIGDVYADLGDFADAEPLLLSALRVFADETGKGTPEVAEILHDLGMMKAKAGAYAEAQTYYEQALAIQESLAARQTSTDQETRALALTIYHLGVNALRQSDRATARSHFERACPLIDELGDDELQARCLEAFGRLLRADGSIDEARSRLEEALRLRQDVLGLDHPHVAASHSSLCVLEKRLLRLAEAEPHCRRALEIRRQSFEPGFHLLIGSFDALGSMRRLQKRYAEAEMLFSEALEQVRERPPENHWQEPSLIVRLGWVLWLQGRYAEAEPLYTEALTFFDDPGSASRSTPINAIVGLGLTNWKLGRLDEAERFLNRAQTLYIARSGADGTGAAWTYWGLAGVYRDRGDTSRRDLEQAGELYRRALDIRRGSYPEGHELIELTEADYDEYLSRLRDRGEP